jgi:N-carbamoyl-L-amino-acid hydrolase
MDDYKTFADPHRISARVDQLAAITEMDRPYTRLVFSAEFRRGRDWLFNIFNEAGLVCTIDSGGSLIGTRAGTGVLPRKKVIVGSHIDTVPAGGRFDGIAGVLAALELVHYLNDQNIVLPFDLEIIDFLGEELNAWGISCLGSRHMAGLITEEMLSRTDRNGRSLGTEIARIGGSGRASEGVRPDADQILGCLELHIEQATILESHGVDIGVVTAIPGIYRYGITVTGQAGHSGTTRMAGRQDALVAAANIITKVSALANKIAQDDNQHFVATIGRIDVFPNGAAIVPGQADMTLDLRAASDHAKLRFEKAFESLLETTGAASQCKISYRQLAAAAAAPMDAELMETLSEEARALGLSVMPISSGAGHDTAHLSRFAPAAMIFIPCANGLSHCPEEFATSEAIAKGAAVIIRTVLKMAGARAT